MFAFGLMALLATVRSNMTMDPMMMNYLMMSKMSDSSDMKKLLLLSPGLFGQDPTQSAQMNQLMPLLLLDDDSDDLNSKVFVFFKLTGRLCPKNWTFCDNRYM